jgi:hypothetical protein
MSFVPSPFFSLRTLLLFLFAAFTSAQTFTCGIVKEKLRSDVLSDNDYANPDSELTPKGAIEEIGQVLCKQLTSTPEEEDFNFVAQVSRNALVSMKLWKPADSDFTVDCASVFVSVLHDVVGQCLTFTTIVSTSRAMSRRTERWKELCYGAS